MLEVRLMVGKKRDARRADVGAVAAQRIFSRQYVRTIALH